MANQERGEVSFKVGEKTYTMRSTLSAMCDLEDLLGMSYQDIVKKAASGDMRTIRALFWSNLQDHHSADVATPKDAGKLIDAVGLEYFNERFALLNESNQPDEVEIAGEDGGVNGSDPIPARAHGVTSIVLPDARA